MATAGPLRANATAPKFDSKNLEIKTKSIEQTLVPLVTQITTLVNHREKPGKKSEKTCKAIERVGQAVNLAIERFVSVGEAIGDNNADIKDDMFDACREARLAGENIAKLTDITYDESGQVMSPADKSAMVRAARGLLSAVTRVLLLADRVVIKQIQAAKLKVIDSLNKIESTKTFTEFVQCFSQFGKEMVELAHLTGDRQNDLKDGKMKAKMAAARAILERSTMMLLTSCKTCLRHPDCVPAKETRNGVFVNMRRALSLIDDVINDGYAQPVQNGIASPRNTNNALQELMDLVETAKVTQADRSTRDKMQCVLDTVIDTTQDFTDSAYTSHEHRERILTLRDRARTDLRTLAGVGTALEKKPNKQQEQDLEMCVQQMSKTLLDLKKQLQNTALDQASEIFRSSDDQDLLANLKQRGAAGELDRVEEHALKFSEHSEQLQEACRLLGHIAGTVPLAISADYAENNIKSLGPQIVALATTLAIHPSSKIAKESLEVFSDTWESQVNDLSLLVKEINDCCQGKTSEKQVYLSLPRPGKHGSTPKSIKPAKLDAEEQAKIAKLGLEMKLMTSELDAETDKWGDQDNDILKRAKNMSSMAYSMYLFTRGEGMLKTTQDLFKQAEYFGEEGNKLFRSLKQFAAQVPDGSLRIELLSLVDQIPSYCQQLLFITKSPTMGKVATFNKVDNTIQETQNLLSTISRIVPLCYTLAAKFQILTPISPIHRWRTAPPSVDYRYNSYDDSDSIASSSSSRSDRSPLPGSTEKILY
ncbi:alpha-catulin-like isoform X2 [Acanthaster planci]|uniref:Alpha-catulin-like isoform X2 n=1 Tax=Acanthaster planci TaxID=133434 RepID=A0A8B8A1C6_ACAPL|nr:alpha-catulin-like isoform X2 [Acanthaster planci]